MKDFNQALIGNKNLGVYQFKAMGSPCEIRSYTDDLVQLKYFVNIALQELARLEKKYSRFLPDNHMAAINAAGRQGKNIAIDAETYALLNYAKTCFIQSDGMFDITSGVLRQIWASQLTEFPTQRQLQHALKSIGLRKLVWTKNKLYFSVDNMEIDFGGIVKEYAADRVANLLSQQGLAHGLVSLGGDVAMIGAQPDQRPWLIKIKHPRKKNQYMAVFSMKQGGLASSGDYERYFVINKQRYSHVFSPITGWPLQPYLVAVSVQAPNCLLAGSMATIAMLKGEQGLSWLEASSAAYVCMDKHGSVFSRNAVNCAVSMQI